MLPAERLSILAIVELQTERRRSKSNSILSQESRFAGARDLTRRLAHRKHFPPSRLSEPLGLFEKYVPRDAETVCLSFRTQPTRPGGMRLRLAS